MLNRMKAVMFMAVLALAVPAMSFAQSTPIFPVDSTTLGQVKTDILAWATALIGVVLAVYAFRRVKAIIK